MEYTMNELFNARDVIGKKLEKTLEDRNYSKSNFCFETGISRPTLDKIINGQITNKTNFEKHLTKILKTLKMEPNRFMESIENPNIKINLLSEILRYDVDTLSKMSGISKIRLMEIMRGETSTLAELRDIAMCLHTGVGRLLGNYIFDYQMSLPQDLIANRESESEGMSGFWGHVGLRPCCSHDYLWYPISLDSLLHIRRAIDKERIVVPCMNNKLLLINTHNIDDLILLDEASDPPSFANWDPKIDCGEVPLAFYEAIPDFIEDKKMDDNALLKKYPDKYSVKFLQAMRGLIEEHNLSDDKLCNIIENASVYRSDGNVESYDIDFDNTDNNITYKIDLLYNFGEDHSGEGFIYFTGFAGEIVYINLESFSVMELPLLTVESAIMKEWYEF